jgi:hypothetical protein
MLSIGLVALPQPASAASGPPIAAGAIQLTGSPGLCLDNTKGQNPNYSQDVQLQVVTCDGSAATVWNQVWTIEADGTIRLDDLCLSGPGSVSAGVALLQPCAGAADQLWAVSDGEIGSATAGYCLAANGTTSGSTVSLASCGGGGAGDSVDGWTTPAVSAQAQALSVAVQLLDEYNFSGDSAGLFTTAPDVGGGSCPATRKAGNCWWWAANALYALTDYAQDQPSSLAAATVQSVLANTYNVFCGLPSTCPTSPNSDGSNDFATLENFQNTYFDDTGWWALAWVNAWELTGQADYLYLAEELWNYITQKGWVDTACGSSLIQYSGTNDQGQTATQDTVANVVYLRLSAWLYLITTARKASQAEEYLDGGGQSLGSDGGAVAVAAWLAGNAGNGGTATTPPSGLISGPYLNQAQPSYRQVAVGDPGSRFMFADHLDQSGCAQGGEQMWLNTQGMAIAAFADMYEADGLAGDFVDAPYYLRIADNLADTIMTETLQSPRSGDLGSYYLPGSPDTYISPPTTDAGGILSEPCDSQAGAANWPYDCDPTGAFLLSKGIVMRGLYCLDQILPQDDLPDPAITPFISTNAASVWANAQDAETSDPGATDLNQFGFNWDATSTYGYDSVIADFATQSQALEALNASLGGSSSMC